MSEIHLDEIRVEVAPRERQDPLEEIRVNVRTDQVVPLDTLVVSEQVRATRPEVIARAGGLEKKWFFSQCALQLYLFLFIVIGASLLCIILGTIDGFSVVVLYTVGFFLLGVGLLSYAILVLFAWCSGYEAKEIFCLCRKDWDDEELREARRDYMQSLQS